MLRAVGSLLTFITNVRSRYQVSLSFLVICASRFLDFYLGALLYSVY